LRDFSECDDQKVVAKQDRNWIIIVIRNPNVGSFIKEKRAKEGRKRNIDKREIINLHELFVSNLSIQNIENSK